MGNIIFASWWHFIPRCRLELIFYKIDITQVKIRYIYSFHELFLN